MSLPVISEDASEEEFHAGSYSPTSNSFKQARISWSSCSIPGPPERLASSNQDEKLLWLSVSLQARRKEAFPRFSMTIGTTDGLSVIRSMGLERSEFLGAEPYERTSQRRGHANGYKDKKIATRVGELRLKIPQVRGLSFYPQSLEKGCRSEKALKLAIAEMYVMGVSTRKVTEITEQLCGTEISASQVSRVASLLDEELEKFRSRPLSGEYPFVYLDAHYEKVRVDGRVQDLAILKAVGVQASGHREVLGLSARLSEAEVHWRAFFEDLAGRGLKGMELVVSDDHAGLKAARRAVFPAVPWQRCQFHLSQNAQRFARRLQERGQIGQAMRDIFNSPTLEDAEAMLKRKIKAFTETNQALAQWMEDNVREGLTVYAFPRSLHKKIRTINGVENLNKQIRRRLVVT